MKKVVISVAIAVTLGLGIFIFADEYPKGCAEPAAHSGQDEPHQQTQDGDQQCHGANGDVGGCTYSNGFDDVEMNCKVHTFTGGTQYTCNVTLECANGTTKACNAVAAGNGAMSGIIGRDPGDNEVYGHCTSSQVDTLLTCD